MKLIQLVCETREVSVYETAVATPSGALHVQRFLVLWDADHDERVLIVAERFAQLGLIDSVFALGKQRGKLTVLWEDTDWGADRDHWVEQATRCCEDVNGDIWELECLAVDGFRLESAMRVGPTRCRHLAWETMAAKEEL